MTSLILTPRQYGVLAATVRREVWHDRLGAVYCDGRDVSPTAARLRRLLLAVPGEDRDPCWWRPTLAGDAMLRLGGKLSAAGVGLLRVVAQEGIVQTPDGRLVHRVDARRTSTAMAPLVDAALVHVGMPVPSKLWTGCRLLDLTDAGQAIVRALGGAA